MIVVSDTSPINNLAAINHLHLLHELYGVVIIPNAVYEELTKNDFAVVGSMEVQTYDWISTYSVKNQLLVEILQSELDVGEAEAIALAVELSAEQLVIDEHRGRMVAARLKLPYTGILGILIEAKSQKLVPEIKPLLDALRNQAGFWIAQPLYYQILDLVNESPK